MDSARKKALKEQYKKTRPQMGIFEVRCAAENRIYLAATQDVPAMLNSIRFQLGNGSFPCNARLLADLKKHGPEGFCIEPLDTLEYDKEDELKTDYLEDLAVLKGFWREKLEAEGFTVENLIPKDR